MFRTLTGLAVVLAACSATPALAEPDVTNLYEISTEGTTAHLKAGDKGHLVISITAKGGAHVSDEAPLRIELTSKEAKLEKQKLTLADSVTKKAAGSAEYPNPKFDIGFTPPPSGKTAIEAKMTFFICTEKLCSRQQKVLTVPVEVL